MAFLNIPIKDNSTPLTVTEWNYLVDKLNNRKLNNLIDVQSSDPQDKDMIRHNGSGWVYYDITSEFYTKAQVNSMFGAVNAVPTNTSDLVNDGDNGVDPFATVKDLELKIDKDIPNVAIGDALIWDGTKWVGSTPAYAVGLRSEFYLDTTTSLSDNFTLSNSPSTFPETANVKATTSALSPVFFERFISSPLGKPTIPAGTWLFKIYGASSSNVGNNTINFRVNKRVIVNGILGTWTGTGLIRTFTALSGTPFSGLTTSGDRLTAPLIETLNQTGWITAVNSGTSVSVNITDIGYVNEVGVELSAIYYWLFSDKTPDINSTTPTLNIVSSVQPEFTGFNDNDRLVLAVFAVTDQIVTRNITLYYGGSVNYTHFETPLSIGHDDLADINAGDIQHITSAQKSDLDVIKVIANPDITGGTKTKITYDSKGLVTLGEDASFDELVDTPETKIGSSLNGLRVNLAEDAIEYYKTTFFYNQGIPSALWNISHNLGKYPSVTIFANDGSEYEGDVKHIDNNNLTIEFSVAVSGNATIN